MYYFQKGGKVERWKKHPALGSGESWVVALKWPGCSGTILVGPRSAEGSSGTGGFTFLLTGWNWHPVLSIKVGTEYPSR